MKRIFLLGWPVAHSVSPAMHNAALQASGLGDWRYELLPVTPQDLPESVARLRTDDCAGANVTVPHKEAIMEWLDGLSETARQIGAVNTIVKHASKLIGENTDVAGFAQALADARVQVDGARAVILGAGGAARAVAFVLAESGAQSIAILNRTASRAAALADVLRERFPHLALSVNQKDVLARADLIVNASSAGMAPNVNETAMPPGCALLRGAVAFDLVYRPTETRFLREAQQAGAQTLGGLGMLVHQGAAAFTMWTGREPPIAAMFDAARQALKTGYTG